MNVWMRADSAPLDRLRRPLDVVPIGSGQPGDGRALDPLGDQLDRFEVTRRRRGNPASMMSTPAPPAHRPFRAFPRRSSSRPGDCSPSRNVVSKIQIRRYDLHQHLRVIDIGS